MKSKLTLFSVLLLGLSACALMGAKGNNGNGHGNSAPLDPNEVMVSAPTAFADSLAYTLTCVVPSNPPGGPITACDWNVTVDGTPISNQPPAGFVVSLIIEKPAPGVTIDIAATARSVRRGLFSTTGFTKTWQYTENDAAPPAPTFIVVAFVEQGDSLLVNLTCVVPTGQEIETCNFTGTRSVDGGVPTALNIGSGLTSTVRMLKPAPASAFTFVFTAAAVRRTLVSTTFTSAPIVYTQADVPPPAPTDIVVEVVPSE